MTYVHKYSNIFCTVIEPPKGKNGAYTIEIGGKRYRQNKSVFEEYWKKEK